ncbi:MAG: hypothetical protein ACKVZ0_15325 [Gemmatimonadales bacterium]
MPVSSWYRASSPSNSPTIPAGNRRRPFDWLRGWSALPVALILGCAGGPSDPGAATRHYLARVDGPLGQLVIGLAVAPGSPAAVGGWAKLPTRPALFFVRGQGSFLAADLAIELTLEDGTPLGTIAMAGGPERFLGSFISADDAGRQPATMIAVDNLPTGGYLAAIEGAPDAPGRGAASFDCGPDGARLLLVDPTGGQRLEVQVVGPTSKFTLGNVSLGRAGGARGTIRVGGDPSPAVPFVSGIVTIKQLDSLGLVGRVQGVARLGSAGAPVSINASVNAAGPDGSCR